MQSPDVLNPRLFLQKDLCTCLSITTTRIAHLMLSLNPRLYTVAPSIFESVP